MLHGRHVFRTISAGVPSARGAGVASRVRARGVARWRVQRDDFPFRHVASVARSDVRNTPQASIFLTATPGGLSNPMTCTVANSIEQGASSGRRRAQTGHAIVNKVRVFTADVSRVATMRTRARHSMQVESCK